MFVLAASDLRVSSAALIVAAEIADVVLSTGWKTSVYKICMARARSQRPEKHEAASAQYTNMGLKIDA